MVRKSHKAKTRQSAGFFMRIRR
ncbi:hypothetical protein YPPY98_4781, partial [Yersinia pestis PY-98]